MIKFFKYIIWKIMLIFRPLPVQASSELPQFRINKEEKSLVLNGVEYGLVDELWEFLLQLTLEKETYEEKWLQASGQSDKKPH